jgi:hypothetical protein
MSTISLATPSPLYGPVDERIVIPPAGAVPTPSHPPTVQARSHRYGEGQTQRTVTQDEQDRLAFNRNSPRTGHLKPA